MYNFKKSKWESKLKIKKYDKNEMYVKELEHFIQIDGGCLFVPFVTPNVQENLSRL